MIAINYQIYIFIDLCCIYRDVLSHAGRFSYNLKVFQFKGAREDFSVCLTFLWAVQAAMDLY